MGHRTGQLLSVNLNLSDGNGTIGAVGQLDSPPRRWHVGWGTGQCNCSRQALYSLQAQLYPRQLAVTE